MPHRSSSKFRIKNEAAAAAAPNAVAAAAAAAAAEAFAVALAEAAASANNADDERQEDERQQDDPDENNADSGAAAGGRIKDEPNVDLPAAASSPARRAVDEPQPTASGEVDATFGPAASGPAAASDPTSDLLKGESTDENIDGVPYDSDSDSDFAGCDNRNDDDGQKYGEEEVVWSGKQEAVPTIRPNGTTTGSPSELHRGASSSGPVDDSRNDEANNYDSDSDSDFAGCNNRNDDDGHKYREETVCRSGIKEEVPTIRPSGMTGSPSELQRAAASTSTTGPVDDDSRNVNATKVLKVETPQQSTPKLSSASKFDDFPGSSSSSSSTSSSSDDDDDDDGRGGEVSSQGTFGGESSSDEDEDDDGPRYLSKKSKKGGGKRDGKGKGGKAPAVDPPARRKGGKKSSGKVRDKRRDAGVVGKARSKGTDRDGPSSRSFDSQQQQQKSRRRHIQVDSDEEDDDGDEDDDGVCDVCAYPRKFQDLRSQKCHKCSVVVHETCYGLPPYRGPKKQWTCHACEAVGKKVAVRVPRVESRAKGGSKKGSTNRAGHGQAGRGKTKEVMMRQTFRPRDCALCSVTKGNHAMHPLYDVDGPDGRQLVLPPDRKHDLPQRLGWVHSLCAFFISRFSTTAGCVYMCDEAGKFYDADNGADDRADDGDDDEDDSEEEDDSDQDGKGQRQQDTFFVKTHHFVIVGEHTKEYAEWYEVIEALRHSHGHKCSVCLSDDSETTRVPVECSAGNDDEHEGFKRKHVNSELVCREKMHVGCAAWGLEGKGTDCNVLFYSGKRPGDDAGERSQLVCECYCKFHTAEVFGKKTAATSKKQEQKRRGGLGMLDDNPPSKPKPKTKKQLGSVASMLDRDRFRKRSGPPAAFLQDRDRPRYASPRWPKKRSGATAKRRNGRQHSSQTTASKKRSGQAVAARKKNKKRSGQAVVPRKKKKKRSGEGVVDSAGRVPKKKRARR